MNISITARKTTIKDSFRDKVEKKLKKFDRFFGDEAKAVVVVTNERDRDTVEVTITSNSMIFRSEKTTADRIDSLEVVCDILFKQIVKNKSKLIGRVREKAFENIDAADLPSEAEHEFSIVKHKKFPLHAMSVEEAILQMNMLGHQFYVFVNGETGTINVVYSRHDNGYGLIEPIQ